MTEERWNVLVTRGHSGEVRQFSVSHGAIRKAIWGFGAGLCLLFALTAWLGMDGASRIQARQLAQRNRILAEELTRIQGQVAELEGVLEDVGGREAEIRTLAGLEPLDDEVRGAGVGGPGGRRPEQSLLFGIDPDLGNTAFAVDYDVAALKRRAQVLLSSLAESGDSLSVQQDRLLAMPTLFPTAGSLSSRFSRARLHPIMNEVLPHPGIDIAAPRGTPILAAGKGRVVRAGWSGGYGQMVEIDHGSGYTTLYAHASRLLVRVGQEVERGEVIAQVGRTGTATSNHLHYEVHINGQQQNPLNFLLPGTSFR